MSESIQFPAKEVLKQGALVSPISNEQHIPLDQLLERKFTLLKNESIAYSERISGLLELSKEYLTMGNMEKAKEVLAFSETIENQATTPSETALGGGEITKQVDPISLFA